MSLQDGQVLVGRFEIQAKVGQGAFSNVYCALDRNIGNLTVAIKAFNPQSAAAFGNTDQMLARFKREANIMRQLRHPHILEIYDLISANDTAYIIMPYLPQTLADRIDNLSLPQACQIMAQICAGLAYAHTAHQKNKETPRVVHCDIKPSNILFDGNQVKIADFGIAHVIGNGSPDAVVTTTPFQAGTIFYMPPEQLEGKRDDPRIDVYALGALFYRMVSGGRHYLKFDTTNSRRAQAKNIAWVYELPPDLQLLRENQIPEALIEVIATALAKDPAKRYAHAGEMRQAIPDSSTLVQKPIRIEPTQAITDILAALYVPQAEAHLAGARADECAELEQARNLYNTLNLDIDNSRTVVEKIFKLYSAVPHNAELERLTLNAANDLANLVLLSASKEGKLLWEAYRWLFPLYTYQAEGLEETLAQSVRENLDKLRQALVLTLASEPLSEQETRERESHIKTLNEKFLEHNFFQLKYHQFIDVLKTGEMPALSKVPPISTASSVKPVASPDATPEKTRPTMRKTNLWLGLIGIALTLLFVLLYFVLVWPPDPPEFPTGTLPISITPQTPTVTSTPILTITPTPTPTPTTTPTPTPTPVLEGTPIPTVIEPISPDNAKFVAPLAEWGTKNQEPIYSIAISPNGTLLASGNAQGEIQLRWMENGNIQAVLEKDTQSVECVTFSENGERLLAGLKDNTAHLWRVNDRTLLEDRRYAGTFINCGFWNNGAILAYQDARNTVYLRAITAGYALKKGEYLRLESNVNVRSVAYSPSGTVVALGTWQGMQLWEILDYDPKVLHNLVNHKGWVGAIAFSADGKLIASGGADPNDHTIQVWDVYSGRHLTTLDGHTNNINDLAFSPDGTIIASASDDQSVRLWRVSDGDLLHTLKGHSGSVNSVVFSPDGMILASGSKDGTVQLWGIAQQ